MIICFSRLLKYLQKGKYLKTELFHENKKLSALLDVFSPITALKKEARDAECLLFLIVPEQPAVYIKSRSGHVFRLIRS